MMTRIIRAILLHATLEINGCARDGFRENTTGLPLPYREFDNTRHQTWPTRNAAGEQNWAGRCCSPCATAALNFVLYRGRPLKFCQSAVARNPCFTFDMLMTNIWEGRPWRSCCCCCCCCFGVVHTYLVSVFGQRAITIVRRPTAATLPLA